MNKTSPSVENALPLETALTYRAAYVLRALNNRMRQKIIKVIHTQKRLNVTDIYLRLRIEQSVASQHLAILRKEDFVTAERAGKESYYALNYKRFSEVDQLIKQLLH